MPADPRGWRPGRRKPFFVPERKLKAAYLYRVVTFVDWPDAAFARGDVVTS